jgi:hypothetical protein
MICGGQIGTGVGFLRILLLPLPIGISPTARHSSSIIRAGTIGQTVATVSSGLSLTPLEKKSTHAVYLCIIYLRTL